MISEKFIQMVALGKENNLDPVVLSPLQ